MKQLILSLSLTAILLSCKKTDSTPTNPTTNKDTTQTSIAKYGAGVTDIDGNKYKTVIIGTQEWMGENLKVSKYNDGAAIPNVVDTVKWLNLTSAAWCNLKNSDSLGKIYGKLYNWYAVDTKKMCPSGWHLPTIDEWLVLSKILNPNFDLIKNNGDTVVGKMLRIAGPKFWSWLGTNDATNSSLFTALPAGSIGNIDTQHTFNIYDTYWWSSTLSLNNSPKVFGLDYNYLKLYDDDKSSGYSIRCLKN